MFTQPMPAIAGCLSRLGRALTVPPMSGLLRLQIRSSDTEVIAGNQMNQCVRCSILSETVIALHTFVYLMGTPFWP